MTHINFPDSFDDDQSLYIAVNNLRTRLTASISSGTTTIPVVSTAGFPTTGFISILTGGDITNTEAITYNGIGATDFLNAIRGAGGTVAFAHTINDNVDLTIVADHHNSLKDAILELEQYVGVSGAENFLRIDDGGDVSIFGDLSIQNTITVTGGATFCFVTVTGTISGSNIFTESISMGGGSTVIDDHSITTVSGVFSNTLTVSGIPVHIGPVIVPDPLNIDTINATTSLTISGEPVATGTTSSSFNLTVKETDGSPSISNVTTLVVTANTLTDNTGGQVTILTGGGGGGSLTVEEQDGLPSINNVNTIKVTNTTLTDEGSGIVSIDTRGGGGAASGTVSSGTVWWSDAPPSPSTLNSGTSFDDEFKSGNLDSKWTEWDVGNSLTPTFPGAAFLEFSNIANTNEWGGIFQDVPDVNFDGDWAIFTKMSISTRGTVTADEGWAGLVVFQDAAGSPATTGFFGIFLRIQDPTVNMTEVRVGSFVNYTSTIIAGSSLHTSVDWMHNTVYLRLRHNHHLDKISCDISADGLGWQEIGEVAVIDPLHMGLVAKRVGGSTTDAYFEFFRWSTVTGRGEILHGNTVAVFHPDQLISAGVSDPLVLVSGVFSESLTISGVPVVTGTFGDFGNIIDINNQIGPSVTVTGVNGIDIIAENNLLTVSGTGLGNIFNGAKIRKNVNQTITNNTTVDVTWQTTIFDTNGWVDLVNNRFIIPSGVDKIRASCNIVWAAGSTGRRQIQLLINGSSTPGIIFWSQDAASNTTTQAINQVSGPIEVNVGDLITLVAIHTQGVSLDIQNVNSTWFAIEAL